jgi:hypothetical protein
MQPAKNVSRGERLIVLHEPLPDSELGHDSFVIALQKKTTLVPEDLGFEKQDSGKWGGGRFHEIGSIDSKNVMIEIQGQVTAIADAVWRGSLGPPLEEQPVKHRMSNLAGEVPGCDDATFCVHYISHACVMYSERVRCVLVHLEAISHIPQQDDTASKVEHREKVIHILLISNRRTSRSQDICINESCTAARST